MTDEVTIGPEDVENVPPEAPSEPEASSEPQASPAAAAAGRLTSSVAVAAVTTNGDEPEDLPPVKVGRLSPERRVLACINDDIHTQRLGPRNNLASLSDALLSDPNTTNPPPPNEPLNVAGLSVEEAVQKVLDCLERLIEVGLVIRKGDINDPAHTYHLTKEGVAELQSRTVETADFSGHDFDE